MRISVSHGPGSGTIVLSYGGCRIQGKSTRTQQKHLGEVFAFTVYKLDSEAKKHGLNRWVTVDSFMGCEIDARKYLLEEK